MINSLSFIIKRTLKCSLLLVCSLLSVILFSCAGGAGGGAGGETTSLCIQGAGGNGRSAQYKKDDPSEPDNFEIFTATITSSLYKSTKSCGKGETLTFENIPVGHYDVVALAKKTDGTVTAKGTATVDIEADVTKSVVIKLSRLFHHTVTFTEVGGAAPFSTQEVSDGYTATKPTDPPSSEGKVFSGWGTSSSTDDNTLFSFNTPVTEDITLYAKYNLVTYKVKYVSAAHPLADDTFTVDNASSYSLPTVTEPNYTLADWYADENFTTVVNSSSVTDLTQFDANNERKIYVKWTVQVTFKKQNGSSDYNADVIYGKTLSLPSALASISNSGALLGGWYKGSVGGDGKVTLDSSAYDFTDTTKTVTEKFTLYAKWQYTNFTGTVDEFITAEFVSNTPDPGVSPTPYNITITGVTDDNISSIKTKFNSLRNGSNPAVYCNLTLQGGSDFTGIPSSTFECSANVGARGILTISLPDTLVNIGDQAFYASSLTSITLPSSLQYIGLRAFAYPMFGSITIPASVTNIARNAFCGNSSSALTSISVEGTNSWTLHGYTSGQTDNNAALSTAYGLYMTDDSYLNSQDIYIRNN